MPSRWWLWAVPLAWAMDLAFRRLARRAPTVALGEQLARRYRGGAPVVSMGFSLVPCAELRPLDEALGAATWDDQRVILSVGRLAAEKNPLLLLDVIRRLRAGDRRWRLVVVGDGPLRAAMEQRIAADGLADAVQLAGEVSNGPQLWALYRASHLFLHVSLTRACHRCSSRHRRPGFDRGDGRRRRAGRARRWHGRPARGTEGRGGGRGRRDEGRRRRGATAAVDRRGAPQCRASQPRGTARPARRVACMTPCSRS